MLTDGYEPKHVKTYPGSTLSHSWLVDGIPSSNFGVNMD